MQGDFFQSTMWPHQSTKTVLQRATSHSNLQYTSDITINYSWVISPTPSFLPQG